MMTRAAAGVSLAAAGVLIVTFSRIPATHAAGSATSSGTAATVPASPGDQSSDQPGADQSGPDQATTPTLAPAYQAPQPAYQPPTVSSGGS